MRFVSVVICALAVTLGTRDAFASRSPALADGARPASDVCSGAIAGTARVSPVFRELRANGRAYRGAPEPVKVSIEGNLIRVQFDGKVFSFRLRKQSASAIGRTDARSHGIVRISSQAWEGCS